MRRLIASISASVLLAFAFLIGGSPATADIPGLEYRTEAHTHQANAETWYGMTCPEGKNAISGGTYSGGHGVFDVFHTGPNVMMSYPGNGVYSYSTASSWFYGVKNLTSSEQTIHTFVVCADIS